MARVGARRQQDSRKMKSTFVASAVMILVVAALPTNGSAVITPVNLAKFTSHDGIPDISRDGDAWTVCPGVDGARLTTSWAYSDSRPMNLGSVRTIEFEMLVRDLTNAAAPAVVSKSATTYAKTPAQGTSQAGGSPSYMRAGGLGDGAVQVDLTERVFEGSVAGPAAVVKTVTLLVLFTCRVASGVCTPVGPLSVPPGGIIVNVDGVIAECLGRLPTTALVESHPYLGGLGDYACTGTHHSVGDVTVGGETGGGFLFSASVSASLSMEVATQYDFACDFAMIAETKGQGGFFRQVESQYAADGHAYVPIQTCTYTGIAPDLSCTNTAVVASDVPFTGAGIAGPGGGGTPAWPLPTQVRACAPQVGETPPSLKAVGSVWYGTLTPDTSDTASWECQEFGIHYIAV